MFRITQRSIIAITICAALLPAPSASLLTIAVAQNEGRRARPRHEKPEGWLPNVEEVKTESHMEREAPPPLPSTIPSRQNSGKPWDGRRVGDPPSRELAQANRERTGRRAYAHRRAASPPAVFDTQFVETFFDVAVLRDAASAETAYWHDQLRVAQAQNQGSLKLAAVELGRTLFESAEYLARERNAHWYVYDLYKTYLMREPDAGGWATWEALVATHGREYVRRGFEESTEFATLIASIVPGGTAPTSAVSLLSARVEPRNQPGHGMLTRDASWSVPLLSLPGRNGLDLGLALAYSSMVWTRSGPYIYFDEDNGFPSPGFRLGFPTVQRKSFNAQTRQNAYLLITPAGRRVELRQTGTPNIYDAADSSYLQLTETGATLLVRSTDGTRLSFTEANGEYRCVEIKDRNGNYITISYNSLGRITNITDTLGRVIVFNYDSNTNLLSITQSWNGQPSHQWVSFGWGTRTMQSSFSAAAVVGIKNGTMLPVLTQVALNDTSHFTFDYTNSLQLSVVKNYFGSLERNATTFIYEAPAGDAPRLLSSSISARNWTGFNNVPAQVTTQYSVSAEGVCTLTAPDGTVYREYYGTGWQRGLTIRSEVVVGGNVQKWTTTTWAQDNPAATHEVNPRVVETNVYDSSQNRRRTVIDYGPYTQYGLPHVVTEFAANGTDALRQTVTDYNLNQPYVSRHLIGLVSQVQVTDGAGQYQAKITYAYDDPSRLQSVPAAATQHDSAYSVAFSTRGNVTSVSRWDATDVSNSAKKLTTYTNYYNTGSPSSTTDPAGHQSSVAYTDAFSDNVNRNTFAYPTTVTDADGFSSYVQYSFDTGATTRTQSPAPAGQLQGAIQTMTYNNLGQLERITTANNGAYKRFWYGAEYTASYATVNNAADELYSIAVTDGLGRVIGELSNHPGSFGGYRLVNTVYDLMGRAWLQSNPTEVNSSWVASGDDAGGIYYTQQTYDWQGRPLVTTHPDTSIRNITYGGCGCAGGTVVTITDEVGRRQKLYSDVLGRQWKMEALNWNGAVYSTRVNTYNARDQITRVRQYQGLESGGVYQEVTKSYDGHGRLVSSKDPIQITATVLTYTADDKPLTVTDARGAKQTFAYNNRDLLTSTSYSGGPPLSPVTFTYDAAGNRTLMTDASGTKRYQYNQLSQLTSETREFSGLSGSFTFTYEYNLGGALKSITDHVGSRVTYAFNTAGMLTTISGSGPHSTSTYASTFAYRAWGAIKDFAFGNGTHQHLNFNARLQNSSLTLTNQSLNATWNFNYYADGKLHKVTDNDSPVFDRAFSYDHIGRLQEAHTGSEARGGSTADGPFKQIYAYDVWENTTNRNYRYWTQAVQIDNATFNNNRRQNWFYDNAGNLTADFVADYGYDAAGRQNSFTSNVTVGGGASPDPLRSALEIYHTFDGNSAPAKKTTISRHEEYVGEVPHVREDTTSIYYLRSTPLGGKVVAELDDTGYKRTGYVFAAGMRIATQTVWSPGFGYQVVWGSTSPATGSEYMAEGSFIIRQELDPLGTDVTFAPDLPLPSEPVFYDPRFEDMPLRIEGGPSAEYERANQEWAVEMLAAFYRPQAEDLWQTGKQSAAMRLLANNPNLGVHYRGLESGEVTRSGAYFGQDAADFLLGINIAVGLGWVRPLREITAYVGVTGGDALGGSSPETVVNDPAVIDNANSKNQACNISVAFTGDSINGMKNGVNYYLGNPGVGFTVTISGLGAGGIARIGNNIVSRKGRWHLQQWASGYIENTRQGDSGPKRDNVKTFLDSPDPRSIFRFQHHTAGWIDHPGPNSINDEGKRLIEHFGKWNFLIKAVNGSKSCEVGFHIISSMSGGTFSAHWRPGLL